MTDLICAANNCENQIVLTGTGGLDKIYCSTICRSREKNRRAGARAAVVAARQRVIWREITAVEQRGRVSTGSRRYICGNFSRSTDRDLSIKSFARASSI